MEHFIAYHSANRMGYKYQADGELLFDSKKLGILKKSIGNIIWVIEGNSATQSKDDQSDEDLLSWKVLDKAKHKGTHYFLCGVWIGEHIDEYEDGAHTITSTKGFDFSPAIQLNEFEWLPLLLKEQSNFSIGFNKIKNEDVKSSLISLLSKSQNSLIFESSNQASNLNYEDEFSDAVQKSLQDTHSNRINRLKLSNETPEKVVTKTTIFRRNPDVVAEVLIRANGFCEHCKQPAPFIRAADKTPYLEVHHVQQLAHGGLDTVANAVALCPNCHRKAHFA